MSKEPAAFLSYAHRDDYDGQVTRFVERLRAEIGAYLGQEFRIFRDREDIAWGQDWRRRIDDSLDSTTFLIAILSPGFFQSPECRRELEKFRERETRLGRDDLILCVKWIEPDEFADKEHPLGAFLRQRQYESWEEFRHEDPYQLEARRRIAKLAKQVKQAVKRPSAARPTPATLEPSLPVPAGPSPAPIRTADPPGEPLIQRPTPGEVRVHAADGLAYVWIPPGEFDMGCSPGDDEAFADEKPRHCVRITRGFWMGQTPVTQAAWQKVMRKESSSRFKCPDLPVDSVTWAEAADYCNRVGGRLPTEAEWEYAARAGTTEPRYGELDRIAWFADNSGDKYLNSAQVWEKDAGKDPAKYLDILRKNGNRTKPVALKDPNSWGLFDTLGNVSEWVSDWYSEDDYNSRPDPDSDPKGSESGERRVLRGGSWSGSPGVLRVSYRNGLLPAFRDSYVGFRCTREAFA